MITPQITHQSGHAITFGLLQSTTQMCDVLRSSLAAKCDWISFANSHSLSRCVALRCSGTCPSGRASSRQRGCHVSLPFDIAGSSQYAGPSDQSPNVFCYVRRNVAKGQPAKLDLVGRGKLLAKKCRISQSKNTDENRWLSPTTARVCRAMDFNVCWKLSLGEVTAIVLAQIGNISWIINFESVLFNVFSFFGTTSPNVFSRCAGHSRLGFPRKSSAQLFHSHRFLRAYAPDAKLSTDMAWPTDIAPGQCIATRWLLRYLLRACLFRQDSGRI